MSQKALIYSMLLICLNISIINSQIPTLNPSQTVNLATGEMQFSLPLGTVQGVSGHDFPVTLNYKAGIRVSDEASPAGLGFSYGAGSIYRKVVYVPDDCKGGMKEDNITPRYYSTPEPDESDLCKTAWWVYFLTGISIVISLILMCIPGTQWAGSIGANITMSVLTVLSVGLQTMQGVIFTPNEYIAGGTHLPSYAASSKPGDPNYGKGYWCGGVDDVPDVYFVNCPYISGELVIAKDSKGEKYFSLRQTNSSSASANLSVKIEYNHSQESFLIILSDGTRLFFEQGWYSKFYNATFWQYLPTGGTDCSSIQEEMLNDSLPNQWMLTKVLFPDFTDLDGDENPGTHPEMNRGSWILFKYDVKEFSGVSQLPFSSQGVPQTSVVSHSNGYLMDIYLDSIITPNQYAKFFYGNNRLDALWFNTADFVNWPKPVSSRLGDVDYWDGYRNREPVSTLLKASNSSIEPLERNVLDSIVFYSADKIKLRKATLNTDYTLRPKCINSYSKDVIGNFVPFSGNSEAASLTLKSLVISGNNNDALFKTIFEYLKPEAEAWQSNLYNMPEGCDNKSSCEKLRMAYYIENRDLFGYYLQNLTMNNDFNESGIEEKTRMSDAWSLQKVTFSTGSSILWHYEPKRYTFANGIQLTDESQNPQVKYGGGIRVRSIDADDGLGNVKTTSYFYTQMPIPGNFEETSTNSCGHATVLPFPYLLAKDQDKRPDATRGGLYTPVKINYEQVIVAENYEWGTHVAPNGYNVYKFITSKDYPNIGQYGAIDFGWKRGMIDTICMYNKSNKLISQEVREYDYTYNNLYKEFWNIPWLKSSNVYPIIENTYGTVRLKKSIQKTNNVENSTSILFANDLHTTSKDKITSIEKEIRSFDIGDKLDPYPGIIDDRMVAGSRVSVCKTTGLGDNNSIDDYIVVRTDGNTIMQLCIGKDVLTESS
ncbi:MAG: hypothetical protein GX640_23780, partial [Fibrobacter sp.]|nr:hypothetical protein [Fibrobacter sp.]